MHRLGTAARYSVLGSTLLAACSGDAAPTSLGLPSAGELGSLPSIASLTASTGHVPGSPTEVYTRIARGALTCWFGASGPLRQTYIYHADAEPPSKGGRSEIVIFAKDPSTTDPRALRAFRVSIAPSADRPEPQVGVENLKIAEPLATRLTADVNRWAANQEGCGEAPVTAGWSAAEPATKSSPAKAAHKTIQAAPKK